MIREIYLDNSATTKPSKAVCDIVMRLMREDYGNPSSMHRKGVDAEHYLRDSAEEIARILKVRPSEICFTSGGTEGNNLAIIGTALAMRRRGKKILTTMMEHPAVSEPLKFLEKEGFIIEKIPVDQYGIPVLSELKELLDEETVLVSTMYVNNEIGSVVPVKEIAEEVHKRVPLALYHTDAVQAFGKFRIYPKQLGIDLLTVSGHKFHGPKGSGFLYVNGSSHIVPILYGGGQMNGLRSGTENVPGIAGIGVAAKEAYTDFDRKTAHMRALRDQLRQGLMEMDGVAVHGKGGDESAPHIVNAAFEGVRSEVLLHALEDRGIYISAGSACSSHKRTSSPTLTAIGVPEEELTSSVRFSVCENNTEEEIDETLAALREVVPLLRRYRPS